MTDLSSFPVSGLNTDSMQILGYTSTDKMLYDFSNTECFYILQDNVLYRVSPQYASTWFRAQEPGVTVVYNPFQTIMPPTGYSNLV